VTGCRGELSEKDFDVVIKDIDGNIIKEGTFQSHRNGFIDIWLDRNQEYIVEIKYEGKTSTQKISAYDGDNTCITTMRLY
jgi:ATP-dependent DNA ligase